jgi:hypothetical protein
MLAYAVLKVWHAELLLNHTRDERYRRIRNGGPKVSKLGTKVRHFALECLVKRLSRSLNNMTFSECPYQDCLGVLRPRQITRLSINLSLIMVGVSITHSVLMSVSSLLWERNNQSSQRNWKQQRFRKVCSRKLSRESSGKLSPAVKRSLVLISAGIPTFRKIVNRMYYIYKHKDIARSWTTSAESNSPETQLPNFTKVRRFQRAPSEIGTKANSVRQCRVISPL